MTQQVSRRKFLEAASALGLRGARGRLHRRLGAGGGRQSAGRLSRPRLGTVYRDLWKYDSTFTFLCAPNDTHNCLLNAYVRSGVVTRIGPTMRYGEATDLDGNRTTHRWDPRVCQKGLALTRRFYGDRRVNQCMVRAGFKKWVRRRVSRAAPTASRRASTSSAAATSGCACRTTKRPTIVAAALKNIAETYTRRRGPEAARGAALRPGDDRSDARASARRCSSSAAACRCWA